MVRELTPQQEALLNAVEDGEEHLAVQAVAGAGKTYATVQAARRSRAGRKGMVAFNKHIAAELQDRLGDLAQACTLHSLGYAVARKAFPDIILDQQKLKRLLERIKPRWFYESRSGGVRAGEEAQVVMELARLCKYTLADVQNAIELDHLVDHYGIELIGVRETLFDATVALLDECGRATDRLDFDDMLWLPVTQRLPIEPFELLCVDEAQDLSRLQQTLARRAGQRLMVVGDTSQAIYGFSGSDCDALPRLCAELGKEDRGCLDRPLTVTFRCPISHVELARKIVPQIHAAPGAVSGIVSCIDPDELDREVMPGDLVICRTNAPLVDAAYRLIASGVPAIVRGRDLGKGLLDLIRRLKAATPEELVRKLVDYERREQDRLERRDAPESAFQSLEDRVLCLDTLATDSPSIEILRQTITDLFSDEVAANRGQVVLSSIHRAKGLEADRVVIVAPEKLPLIRKDQQPWECQQELNLCYIAATRAKQELIFAGDVPDVLGGSRAATCSVLKGALG